MSGTGIAPLLNVPHDDPRPGVYFGVATGHHLDAQEDVGSSESFVVPINIPAGSSPVNREVPTFADVFEEFRKSRCGLRRVPNSPFIIVP